MEERRAVVSEEYVEPTTPRAAIVEEPVRHVVESAPPTYVQNSDPVGNSIAASRLIQTVVWAAVVLVLLIVGILVLVHYNIL